MSEKHLCRPWSREDYLQRVATYLSSTWFGKPDRISASECARFGWVNSGPDMLWCRVCHQYLACSISSSLDLQSENAVIEQLHEALNSKHSKLCPWRDNHTSPQVANAQTSSPSEILASFQTRKRSISKLEKQPLLHSSFLSELKNASLPSNLDTNESTTLIAASGWEAFSLHSSTPEKIPAAEAVLRCSHCQRQLGLWNFTTVGEEEQKSRKRYSLEETQSLKTQKTDFSSTAAKSPIIFAQSCFGAAAKSVQNNIPEVGFSFLPEKTKIPEKKAPETALFSPPSDQSSQNEDKSALHPIREHASFCPWVKSSTNLPPWKHCLDLVKNPKNTLPEKTSNVSSLFSRIDQQWRKITG